MKNVIVVLVLSIGASLLTLRAQGPAITSDSPIMLGGETMILRTLVETRNTTQGQLTAYPLIFQYLTSSNSAVTVQVPFVNFSFDGDLSEKRFGLGDISIEGKYQFYRKDGKARTFRVLAKTVQTIPTGEELNFETYSSGFYQSYFGVFAGYESLKRGITNELGYVLSPSGNNDELRYKLGFGMPLLKPSYPVNQLNLYFEYTSRWFTEFDEYSMLFAQGVQYAKGRYTIEAAVQIPLIQNRAFIRQANYSLFFGSRVILN